MKIYSLIIVTLTLTISCNTTESQQDNYGYAKTGNTPTSVQNQTKEEVQFPKLDTSFTITSKTFIIEDGWGYEIYKDSTLLIRQKNIPAVQGLKTFSSEVQAKKTAEFVANKIKQGMFPPTISINELESLGVKTN